MLESSVMMTALCVCSFIADTDQLKDQWVEAMSNSIGEALSNYEVAERIWAEPSNQMCADCSAAKPEWAAINLTVVFCKRCAGNNQSRPATADQSRPATADQSRGKMVL